MIFFFFFFQAEDGIRDAQESRGLGDVYKRQVSTQSTGDSLAINMATRVAALLLLWNATVVLGWTEEDWLESDKTPGLPNAPCLSGVAGVCGRPSSCQARLISGKCHGGSDNVCCIPNGAPGGNCLRGVVGTCGLPSGCAASLLVSGKCSGGSDNVCCQTLSTIRRRAPSSSLRRRAPSSSESCTGADLWAKVLNHPQITLASTHSSGKVDTANARQEVVDAAGGKRATRSAYYSGGQGPGGSTCLEPAMARFLLQLADEIGGVRVNEVAGGTHSTYSSHYAGHAVDVGSVGGARMTSGNPHIRKTLELCKANGADWQCSADKSLTKCSGHSSWTHCQWNKWKRELDKQTMRAKGWPSVL
eukprot:TRINITY_DN4494_c0_g1_i3.p1 TRINITY_DN4494_c0_g1~~TRINITY_DN4494_c0_g1_i3.p1  ORF type:complete len:360 (+),score=52.45 TRINITY_DN4494_c0_g1_i3:94-1173(+)